MVNIDKLEDRKGLTFFTELNPTENTPINNAKSLKDYLRKNLVVGVELELNYKHDSISSNTVKRVFGVYPTCYHEYIRCEDCSLRGRCLGATVSNTAIQRFFCHTIIRNNGIISIQEDFSIDGLEFLFQGSNETTEEFIEKLPIKKLSKYFTPTYQNGIHTHILMPFLKKQIPNIVFKNLWQLFRKYYIGIVYLSGTTENSILRGSEYSRFYDYNITPLKRNMNDLGRNRNGLYFGSNNQDTMLNIEIRTFDSSINALHIALCRFLTKALFIRAVELSEYGLMQIANTRIWRKKKIITKNLNGGYQNYTQDELNIMKDVAEELYVELNHLFTDIERGIIRQFIKLPIWDGNLKVTPKKLEKKQLKALTKQVAMLVTVKAFFGKNRQEYYQKLSNTLNTTPNYIRDTLSRIGANWNKELNTFEIQ